ncbi:hypothetical protein OB952_22825, partial [Aeromonas salmonicida]
RPVGDGVKRRAHDADLKEMVVIRSPSPQLVPFKLHRFGQQRPALMFKCIFRLAPTCAELLHQLAIHVDGCPTPGYSSINSKLRWWISTTSNRPLAYLLIDAIGL